MRQEKISKMKKRSGYLQIVEVLKPAVSRAGIKARDFIFPVILSFFSALCEGVSIALLAPLAKGIADKDFSFIQKVPGLHRVFDILLGGNKLTGMKAVIIIAALIVLFSLAKHVLKYAASYLTSVRQSAISRELKNFVFERLLSFGKMYYDRSSAGYLSAIFAFARTLPPLLNLVPKIVDAFFNIAVYVFVMIKVSWQVTLLALFMIPVVDLGLRWLHKKIKRTSVDAAEVLQRRQKYVLNLLSCICLIKANCTEERESRRFRKLNEQARGFALSMAKKNLLMYPLQDMFWLVFVLMMVVFMGYMVFVAESTRDLAGFLVLFVILRRSQGHFKIFQSAKNQLSRAEGAVRKVLDFYSDDYKFYVPGGEKEFTGLKDSIEVRGLDFSYLKGKQVLKNVSFAAEKGRMTAIVGATGSGKSTLINLLMRFYDCPPGTIFIDGTDIREFNIASLRGRFALVNQDVDLLNDTLRFNITYGLEQCDNKQLIEAVEKSRLDDFIINTPDHLETVVGDRGVQLSGGEKQRVAIARAILRNSSVLFLDEATSALDVITERMVQQAIDEAVRGRTTIVIAHRLSTIKNADWIVVLDDGEVVEQGSFGNLMDKKGRFRKYWDEQKFE